MAKPYKVVKNKLKIVQTNNVQLEDIRLMLLDVKPEDYAVVSNSLFWTDEELMDAMRRAIEAYNAMPPFSIRVGVRGLPDQYIFKVGTCWQAHLSKFNYFTRKQVNYTTGDTTVNKYQAQIQYFQQAAATYKDEFMRLAALQKHQINVRNAYGRIG